MENVPLQPQHSLSPNHHTQHSPLRRLMPRASKERARTSSSYVHLPSSGKSTPTSSLGRRTPTPSIVTATSERARLPVRMMRRVKVVARPGTSHSDDNSRATTPSIDHLHDLYTKSELDDYRQLFRMFDTDGSGSLGKEELKEAMLSIGLQADDAAIDELIREVDEDSNGEIDFEEFCRCMKRSHNIFKSTAKDEVVRQCFDIFDQDGNGVITRNEFMYIAREIGGFSDALADYVFHQLDVSSNGHLSTEQFAAIVEDYLLTDQNPIFEQDS